MYFKHKYITMPSVTSANAVVQDAKELIDALKHKMPAPLSQPSTAQIKSLSDIFTPNIKKEIEVSSDEEDEQTITNSQRVPVTEGAQEQRVPTARGCTTTEGDFQSPTFIEDPNE